MIKFTAPRKGGGKVIGFGLSHDNLMRLIDGKPVQIEGSELGVGEFSFYIFSGKTEESMQADLRKAGIEIAAQPEVH